MSISGAPANTTPYSQEEQQKIYDKLKTLALLWELPNEELSVQLKKVDFAKTGQEKNGLNPIPSYLAQTRSRKSLSFLELSDDLADPQETEMRNRNLP